jgi:hypothetical protein
MGVAAAGINEDLMAAGFDHAPWDVSVSFARRAIDEVWRQPV